MKKLCTILVALAMVFVSTVLLPTEAQATENEMIIGTPVSGTYENKTGISYSFTLDKPGAVTIIFSAKSDATEGRLYCSITGTVGFFDVGWSSIAGKFSYTITKYLEKGEYAFNFSCSGNGTYTVESIFEEAKESFEETQDGGDNTVDTANVINLSETYYGLIMDKDVDLFSFTIDEDSAISVSLNCYAPQGWFSYTIYDEKLDVVIRNGLSYYDKTYGQKGKFNNTYDLIAGKYYLLIRADDGLNGPYDFSVAPKHTVHIYDNDCDGTCNVCGAARTISHTWNSGEVTKGATCKEEGVRTYTCTACNATKTETIAKTTEHKYGSWAKVNDTTHKHTCSVCQKEETVNHSWDGGSVTKKATCQEAGIKTYTCTACNATKTEAIAKLTTHTYDNACDTSCNVCGGTRTVTHQYDSNWSKNESIHWHTCTICGNKANQSSHTPGAAATETTAQTCTTCGYVIQAALGHTHKYSTEWNKDASGHWYACNCGSQKDYEAHNYKNSCDAECDACGHTRAITHTPGAAATATTDQVCTVCGKVLAEATGETESTTPPTEATTPPTETPTEPETEPATEPSVPETTEPPSADEPTEPENTTAAPTEPVNDTQKDDGFSIWIPIVVVLIAGGAAAGVIIWKKKH